LAWQTGGADGTSDRKQTAEDTVAVGVTGVWYEWDLTALAAQWLAGTADNYGVILISDVEGQQADKVFCTNERAAEHPILELEYVPEPVTAITLLVGGLVALVSRTRRRRK
ncbi:MAG: DNRLRE domain-containing protein, partial [Actinobacteria bacterium]|nr:DNRLRE domain-containing protein [Actinomycetota bacterium]